MAIDPSARGESFATVKDQLLLLSVFELPRDIPSAKSSTLEPIFAVPENEGVLTLVRLSEFEMPLSEAAIRSGVEGGAAFVEVSLI
ncbi:hypothetical protein PMIT1323_01178 [Prochlorococcus marinus str. MIT 1323]|nr:hypothetical protein PMIT1323_01178 [Prochlorococcus marinus str. MIT 1323]